MYIVIAGGGMVGGQLARRLLENKHDVVLIDKDQDVCDKLYARTGVVAICGSATRFDVLNEAGISKADILVAATGEDADNLACAVLGKSAGVPHVIVRMRDPNYENAFEVAGVERIVRMTDMMVNQMLVEIENPQVRRVFTIGRGRANIFMVVVPKDAKVAGRKIMDIVKAGKFPSQCIFIAVYNKQKEEFSIPRGEQVVNAGDELFLISAAEDIKKVVDILTAKKAGGAVAQSQGS